MTDDQFENAAKAAKQVVAWRSAVQDIEELTQDRFFLYGVPTPPAEYWDNYKEALLGWAKNGLAEAQAEFAAL